MESPEAVAIGTILDNVVIVMSSRSLTTESNYRDTQLRLSGRTRVTRRKDPSNRSGTD
jgi:hypothetical protein